MLQIYITNIHWRGGNLYWTKGTSTSSPFLSSQQISKTRLFWWAAILFLDTLSTTLDIVICNLSSRFAGKKKKHLKKKFFFLSYSIILGRKIIFSIETEKYPRHFKYFKRIFWPTNCRNFESDIWLGGTCMYLKLSYLQGILQNLFTFGVKGLEEPPIV